jgi:hypothetical protein
MLGGGDGIFGVFCGCGDANFSVFQGDEEEEVDI